MAQVPDRLNSKYQDFWLEHMCTQQEALKGNPSRLPPWDLKRTFVLLANLVKSRVLFELSSVQIERVLFLRVGACVQLYTCCVTCRTFSMCH